MRVFQRHQILLAHAYARSGRPAVCILDIVESRAKLFHSEYEGLMATIDALDISRTAVPQCASGIQFIELTGKKGRHLIHQGYWAEQRPNALMAKEARRAAWEHEQGLAMLGAT